MKILFDQCIADDLEKSLPDHDVRFSRQMSWAELSNGQLLAAAEAAGFDLMITSDKNLKYQQNLSKRRISIIVLGNNYWPEVQRHLAVSARQWKQQYQTVFERSQCYREESCCGRHATLPLNRCIN